ncbi:hypothetical protein AGLY_013766, partial [Aphis glycines]
KKSLRDNKREEQRPPFDVQYSITLFCNLLHIYFCPSSPTRPKLFHSERSDECIGFTMIITSRNASISNFGGGFRWKSEYPWCIIEVKSKLFPTVFKKIEKNPKKIREKQDFLRKTSFRQNRIFYFAITQKLIDFEFIRNMSKLQKFASNFVVGKSFSINFSSNICKKNYRIQTKTFYECLKFKFLQNRIVIFFTVDKIFLALSKYLKILYKVPHMLFLKIHIYNFFLLSFEVQILTKIRQNYEYLQIIFLKSTPPPNVKQNDTHLPAFLVDKKKSEIVSHNFFYKFLKFEFIRNMSKLQKFASNFVVGKSFSINFSSNICKKNYWIQTKTFYECFKFKFLQNRTNEIFNFPKNFFLKCLKIFLALSKYLKILYKVPHIIHRHNFFLLAFEVQILTKIRQNYEYLQIIFLAYIIIKELKFWCIQAIKT